MHIIQNGFTKHNNAKPEDILPQITILLIVVSRYLVEFPFEQCWVIFAFSFAAVSLSFAAL